MKPFPSRHRSHRLQTAAIALVAAACLTAAALVGVALAKSFTLQVARDAKVTGQSGTTTRENLVVTSRGFAVYRLTGDSRQHPECTKANGCFRFWPPVTVASGRNPSKASGIGGKLGVWHRDGLLQVTLSGHPLYRFAPDPARDHATGEGIVSFGGTWHVAKAAGSSAATTTTTTTSSTTMTSTSTSTATMPCVYPPCY